jgi:asparagine synthase (glutamine-hydrolysing)
MQRVLPEKIPILTDKIGFAATGGAWLRRGRPEAFQSTFRAAMEASSCVLSPNALDFLNEVIDGRHSFSFAPWRMISFGGWVKRFDVQVDG